MEMDEVTRKRIDKGMVEVKQATEGVMNHARDSLPTNLLDEELAKVGVPPEANLSAAFHLLGYAIGNMIAFEISKEVIGRLIQAVADVTEVEPYDLCTEDIYVARVDALVTAAGVCEDHQSKFDQWARLFRNALTEIYFGLEDHFADPVAHPGTELRDRACKGALFFLDVMWPVFSGAVATPAP